MSRGYLDEMGEYCEGYEQTYSSYKPRNIKAYKHLPRELKGLRYFLYDNAIHKVQRQNEIIFNYWFECMDCHFKVKNEDVLFNKLAQCIQLDFVKFVKFVRKQYLKK